LCQGVEVQVLQQRVRRTHSVVICRRTGIESDRCTRVVAL
jgi:hypothetical protein